MSNQLETDVCYAFAVMEYVDGLLALAFDVFGTETKAREGFAYQTQGEPNKRYVLARVLSANGGIVDVPLRDYIQREGQRVSFVIINDSLPGMQATSQSPKIQAQP